MSIPKFSLGQLVATPNALDQVPSAVVEQALSRHINGDWGDLDRHGIEENNRALHSGCRLLSAYVADNAVRFWIITEAERTVTAILLPEDY